jgi:dTDP-4-dehydrorhamnose 3,5-epimerase
MQIIPTNLPDVIEVIPDVYSDSRGYFLETYQNIRYKANGIKFSFVQDNLSYSKKNTLRGLHFQHPNGQGKLIQVVKGEIYDVAVDVRRNSPTFGQWVGVVLSDTDIKQLFVPAGFAHGFYVISKEAYVLYKCTEYYSSECELGILWSDPFIGIDWPTQTPLISPKDGRNLPLNEIVPSQLPST